MGVADELAALRAKGSVKARASGLANKGGKALSTPEAEAAGLQAKKDNAKLGKVKAKEILNKGSKTAAQAEAAAVSKLNVKKANKEKEAEASKILQKGGSGSGYSQEMEHSLNQTGKKKAEREKKVQTQKGMANQAKTKAAAAANDAPQAAEPAKSEAAPAVEEVDDDDVPTLEEVDDDVPDLETAANDITQQTAVGNETAQDAVERQITNRNEKKARKMMTRLGMRPVPQIARVTLKAGGGRGYFYIDGPDVYQSTSGKQDTYVIFGEARQGGQGGFGGGAGAAQAAQAQAAMAQAQAAAAGAGGGMPSVVEDEDVPDLAGGEESAAAGGADEEGVEAKDIDLVMSQASCSRAKAVVALKENDGDLVNAIMSLTT